MKFLDDILKSRDGSYSLTKVAAATSHFNAAWLFVYLTLTRGYIDTLWGFYLGLTIAHQGYDKFLASRRSKPSE